MSFITLFLIFLAVLGVLYLARRPIFRTVGNFLISKDKAHEHPDAIVLMNGNISTRPFRAVELYKNHPAPILLARLADTQEVRMGVIPNISEATRDLLVKLGVSGAHIHLLKSDRWIAGTWNEAILHCATIRNHNFQKITIVSDAFHTRRARWTFRKVMRDNEVDFRCAATPYTLDVSKQWWRSEYGLVQVVVEYLKFLHYLRIERDARHKPAPVESELPTADEIRPLIIGKSDLSN